MSGELRSILAAVQTESIGRAPLGPQGRHVERAQRFVTISRQAGAGGATLAQALCDRLKVDHPKGPPWRAFDRELVEQVAHEHGVSASVVSRLEEEARPFLLDALKGLSFSDQSDELALYRRVAATIRRLAGEGRVVIVGRGGAFVTRDMPGGVHALLVAPFDFRVHRMTHVLGVGGDDAARRVRQIDAARAAFYRRYFPRVPLAPERFTVTLNTADLTEQQCVAVLLTLLQ